MEEAAAAVDAVEEEAFPEAVQVSAEAVVVVLPEAAVAALQEAVVVVAAPVVMQEAVVSEKAVITAQEVTVMPEIIIRTIAIWEQALAEFITDQDQFILIPATAEKQ